MFKILLLILGLAAYGAYSLVSSFGGNPDATAAAPTSASSGLGSWALSAASGAVGLDTAPLPTTGCQENALSRDNLAELVSALPDVQREALLALIDKGAAAVTVQWYSGPDGVGLCLPAQGKRVLLPAVVTQTISGLVPPG